MGPPASEYAEELTHARLDTVGTMVAGIAHELNTPLGAIHSNHDVIERALLKLQDILEDEVVTPDELEQVRRIVRALDGVLRTNGIAVERMVRLVEGLRTFGRPDGAEVDWVDLREGIDGTLMVLAHEMRGIEVERRYGDLPSVECFPDRLNQVFMNLLHNSAQAMHGGGKLGITTACAGDTVIIEISDTGPGIAPEVLSRIFEPGFTTKGGRVGMGLGLAITRQIVDQHGGKISAKSRVGEGTTFRLELPARLSAARKHPEGGDDESP